MDLRVRVRPADGGDPRRGHRRVDRDPAGVRRTRCSHRPGRPAPPRTTRARRSSTTPGSTSSAPGRRPWSGVPRPARAYDADAIRRLKDDTDGVIYVSGSGTLVRGLLADGLVDELHLFVYPIALGVSDNGVGRPGPYGPAARTDVTTTAWSTGTARGRPGHVARPGAGTAAHTWWCRRAMAGSGPRIQDGARGRRGGVMAAHGVERSRLRLPTAAAALVGAAAHVPVTGEHLREATYIGVLFIVLEVALVCLAVLLVVADRPEVWAASVVVPLLAIAAYVASRSVGLPQIGDDVGRWTEPLGVVAVAAESVMALFALVAPPPAGPARVRPGHARRAGTGPARRRAGGDRRGRRQDGRAAPARRARGDGRRVVLGRRGGLAARWRRRAPLLRVGRPGRVGLRAGRDQRDHPPPLRRGRKCPGLRRRRTGPDRVEVHQVPLPRLHGRLVPEAARAARVGRLPRPAGSGDPGRGRGHHPGGLPQHVLVPDEHAPARRVLRQGQ